MPETITDADVTAASREAELAQRRFLELEHAALHSPPGARPSAAEVVAQRTEAEHAAARVEITRRRLEEAREAARLAGLEAVGADVEAYAATDPGSAIRAALEKACEAVSAYRAVVTDHDTAVADLHARAGAFADATGRTLPVLRGQGASSVRFGEVEVRRIGDNGRIALEDVLAGDLPKARGRITPVIRRGGRADHYFRDLVDGGVLPCNGSPRRAPYLTLLADRRIREMTAAEVDAYLKGQQ